MPHSYVFAPFFFKMFCVSLFSEAFKNIERILGTLEVYSTTGGMISTIDYKNESPNFLNRIEYCWVKS